MAQYMNMGDTPTQEKRKRVAQRVAIDSMSQPPQQGQPKQFMQQPQQQQAPQPTVTQQPQQTQQPAVAQPPSWWNTAPSWWNQQPQQPSQQPVQLPQQSQKPVEQIRPMPATQPASRPVQKIAGVQPMLRRPRQRFRGIVGRMS